MKDRRIQIVDVNRIARDVVAEIVRLAESYAGFDSSAGKPHSETARMMIAPVISLGQLALGIDGAAEFPAPDDQGVIEHPAVFQIHNQRGGRLIGVLRLFTDVPGQSTVMIPATMK